MAEKIIGTPRNDILKGSDDEDIIYARAGNDTITGAKGNDKLYGEEDNDIYVFNAGDGNDIVYSTAGSDTLKFTNISSASNFPSALTLSSVDGKSLKIAYTTKDSVTINNFSASAVKTLQAKDGTTMSLTTLLGKVKINITGSGSINGTAYHDKITGSAKNDSVLALAGNDAVYGGAGNDTLNGADGNDVLIAEAGNDIIYGGNGNDTLNGGDGDDSLYGGVGNDIFYGGNGSDLLNGGDGDDSLYGGAGNDTLYGGAGNDLLNGGDGNDIFNSGAGNDTVYGGAGTDLYVFNKGDGNDIVYSSAGSDIIKFTNISAASKLPAALTFSSTDGKSLKIAYTTSDSVTINNFTSSAIKTVQANDGTTMPLTTLLGKVKINITGSGSINGTTYHDKITGSAKNDSILANAGNDLVYGGAGNDILNGGDGNDSLIAEAGNDTIYGGNGNDTLNGGDGFDSLYGGIGNDIFYGGNGSDLLNGGDGDDSLYGGADNDTLYGGTGNDILNGGDGNDLFYSGAGNDFIYGGAGTDLYVFNKGDGNDIVYSSAGTDTIKFTNVANSSDLIPSLQFFKEGNYLKIGYTTNDNVSVNNYFNYQSALKYIQANDGSKTEIGTLLQESVIEMKGSGVINGTLYSDKIFGSSSDDTIAAGDGDDITYGGLGDDVIDSGLGLNSVYLFAGDGNDILDTKTGTDTIIFEEGMSYRCAKDSDNKTVIYYNDDKDSIKVTSYVSTVYVKVGSEDAVKINTGKGDIKIGILEKRTFSLAPDSSCSVFVKNAYTGKTLEYTAKNIGTSIQSYDFENLKNGRLFIKGNYLELTAAENQTDDLIINGGNNKIYTKDYDDIVRLGYVVDADGQYYNSVSSRNTVDTGAGDDHVTLNGSYNSIEMGTGTDSLYNRSGSNNTINDDERNLTYQYYTDGTQDEHVGFFSQGRVGDCRLFSLLNSIENSSSASFSDAISINSFGNYKYIVTFDNYSGEDSLFKTKSFTVSDLSSSYKDKSNKFYENSYGDMDVCIADYAMNKLVEYNKDNNQTTVQTAYYNTLSDYIFGTTDITWICGSEEVTNNRSKNYLQTLSNQYLNGEINNLVIVLQGTTDYSQGYVTSHAYSVSDMENNRYITLVNPWNNGDRVTLDLTEFNDNLYSNKRNLEINAFVFGNWIKNMQYDEVDGEYTRWTVANGSYLSEYDIASISEETVAWKNKDFESGLAVSDFVGQNADYNLVSVVNTLSTEQFSYIS